MKRTKRQNTILALLLMFCANNFSIAQKAIINGTVRYGNESLQAATVSVGVQAKLTDANGSFTFSVSPGTYKLTITHAGYKKTEQTITAEAGLTTNLEFELIPDDHLETVTLGSRSVIPRSNLNTAVPIDIFSSAKLIQTGHVGLIQALQFSAPSINTGRQELNEPVTLRGLGPDQILIMVNEIRHHSSSYQNNGTPKSSIGRGSVTNDINSIPLSAVENVEILRDGASAQYGSDGIAGVMNIQLKKTTGKASIQLHNGQYYKGDGEKFWLGGYKGVSLKGKGFISFASDIRFQNPTTRDGEYLGTSYYPIPPGTSYPDSVRIKAKDDSVILARGIDKSEYSKYNGNNKVIAAGVLMNGGYNISKRSKFFWTSLFNYRKNWNAGTYRHFRQTTQVNIELYPNGFRPIVKVTNRDFSIRGGFETETRKKWNIKLNSSFGSNFNNSYVSNSNNASQQFTLGKNAPTEFYLGELVYKLFLNNISFIKNFATTNTSFKTLNLAIGAEWRLENYQQHAGDETSWKNYDTRKTGGSQPSIGSINKDNVFSKQRNVSAAYIDLELEPNNRFLIDLASRYEYYSDFGGNLAGKIAVRYYIAELFSLRGSISNGFRAPSMQQRFFEGTQSFRGTAQISGIFSNISPVTKEFNIPSLQAERSINVSGGFVSKLSNNLSLTADAYWIQIKNRVVLSGVFDTTNADIKAILTDYPNIDFVQFYVNAINTRTKGIDIVLNGRWMLNKTRLELTMAAGFNHNSIYGPIKTTAPVSDTARYRNTLFGVEEITTLERDQPRKKIIFSGNISKGRFGFAFRNTLFGNTALAQIVTNPRDTLYETFSSKVLTDISINYTPKAWLTITTGVNNVFDVYPDRNQNYRLTGQGTSPYSNGATPYGFNGGYYYVSMRFKL
jgi:iron complex outermembrane recepter protein